MQIIKQEEQFVARLNGQDIGHIHFYQRDGNFMIVDHTYVDPEQRGLRVAQQLLDTVVEHAREQKMKIIPQCSYVSAAFKRFPQKYADVDAS